MSNISPAYSQCATENQQCSFTGPMSIAYTAATTTSPAYYRNAPNGIPCNNTTFGDPSPNNPKQCLISNIPTDIVYVSGIPTSFTKCADEKQTCNPGTSNPVDILYGANGSYVYANATSVPCNNTIFGDPSPNNPKACYWRIPTQTSLAPPMSPQAPIAPTQPIAPAPLAPIGPQPSPSPRKRISTTDIIIIIVVILLVLIMIILAIYFLAKRKRGTSITETTTAVATTPRIPTTITTSAFY